MLLLLIFSIFLSSVESFHSSTFVSSNTSSREDATSSSSLPHIILVIIDDYGWANFEAHRTPADDPTHEVQTPVQLELAKEGVLLNRHYGFWYCSPSRSAIQTGRNPIHVNMNNDDLNIFNLNDPISGYAGIPVNMTTIAWKMREANYSTAFYGKHHLGLATPAHTPAGRGFEQSQIYFDGANDYWTQIGETCGSTSVTDLWITGNGTNDKPYGYPAFGLNNSWSCSQSNQSESCVFEDTMFVNRAIQTIESQDPTRPLFMIFAPHNCHAPLQVPKAAMDKFSFIEDPRRQAYAAKAWWVDNAIGEIVTALKSKGFWDQTAFFVTSDNVRYIACLF
jgi:arylsulfatase B